MFSLTDLRVPIIAAPMAGGASTPELVRSVSAEGGLGFLAAGYKTPDALAWQITDAQRSPRRPFGVNVFVPAPPLTEIASGTRSDRSRGLPPGTGGDSTGARCGIAPDPGRGR